MSDRHRKKVAEKFLFLLQTECTIDEMDTIDEMMMSVLFGGSSGAQATRHVYLLGCSHLITHKLEFIFPFFFFGLLFSLQKVLGFQFPVKSWLTIFASGSVF